MIVTDDKIDQGFEGMLYEAMAVFGRVWHWSSEDVLRMPIRRRNKLLMVCKKQIDKSPPLC